ncbi:hypothetical protein BCR32DRAFT_270359 [Anaeromyces robustus]|uniref:Brl1/Brr6 domain-containing protein n=1 Tax=Anaeromyces robustus TaxID=1754192 RepID=A0A1Y1WWH2_9FUNG|nr:hypothetical protein BCR32DRAFT_270359 [Anaeromyces robustus]|eukprot:ORX77907.1 hypothetical protein BCR32DRAFT_270359 [Anaeromyces robustus]
MFIRYPYRRDNYYRSRVAPMEIDRDDAPIWAVPVARKKIIKNDDSDLRKRHTTTKKIIKGKTSQEKEEENSNTKLIKYSSEKFNSKDNRYNEELDKEYNNDPFDESESDYEEDSINTENKMSFEFQHPSELVQSFSYDNDDYLYTEANNKSRKKKYGRMRDSSFPKLLLSYFKFFFNVLLLVVALWILFYFIKTVRSDITSKYNEHLMDNMNKISECYDHYKVNKCSSDIRIPALKDTCRTWEACMSQNPDDIRIIMIAAEVVSEILNKFIEPLSIKTTIVIIALCTIFYIIIWKMSSIPSNKQKQKKSFKEEQNNRINNDGMPIGMCPHPSPMDSRFIGNNVMYPVAPAAIYPGESPYSMPIAYPPIYPVNPVPYPAYPIYQQEPGIPCFSRSNMNHRKSPRKPQSQSKNYRFVKSSHNINNNRNPYQSKFKVNHPYNTRNKNNYRERYYYRVEDNDNDSNYEMVNDEGDSYYDEEEEYGY